MKKLFTVTIVLLVLFTAFTYAQDVAKKKKPGFTLNEQTMAELSITPEQKVKIEENRNTYRTGIKKIQMDGVELDNYCQRRIDSVLTDLQKQKVTAMKSTIATQNKETTAAKKAFVYDQKTMDEIALSPEQQKKITALKGAEQVSKWKHAQKMNQVMTETFARENAILTEAQQKKVVEIKASIAEYNKDI